MRNYDRSPVDTLARRHFGGGGGSKPKPQPVQYTPPPVPRYTPPPVINVPPPAPVPPPAVPDNPQTTADTQQSQQQAALKRQGYRKTILAGDTGGYTNPVTGSSLLG